MKSEHFFRCLADPLRIRLVLLILQEGEQSSAVLAKRLACSESVVRRQMALLNKHQLVVSRQKELLCYYRINSDLPIWMQKILKHTYRGNKKLLNTSGQRSGADNLEVVTGAELDSA